MMQPIHPADRADWQSRTEPPVCFHHSDPYCQLCGDIGEFRDVEYRADLPEPDHVSVPWVGLVVCIFSTALVVYLIGYGASLLFGGVKPS